MSIKDGEIPSQIWEKKNSSLRRGLAGYLCDQWNSSREDETLDKALSVDSEFEFSVNKEYLKRGPREGIDLGKSYDCQVLQRIIKIFDVTHVN